MLADCPSFQTFTGEGSAAAAETHCYHDGLPRPSNGEVFATAEWAAFLPLALIFSADDNALTLTRIAHPVCAIPDGIMFVELERLVPDDENEYDTADRKFKNLIGAIMEELIDRSQTASFLDLDRVAIVEGPRRQPVNEDNMAEGQTQWVRMSMRWGSSEGN